MRNRSKSPKPNFRNTKSKFYKKKNVNQTTQSTSEKESTGDYWKAKGNEAINKGNTDLALKHYTKAIEMNPGQSIYFSNRAKCYKMKGFLKQALKDAEEACQLQEKNIKAHYLCGCILAQMGKKDESKLNKAENRFKKALRLCKTLKQQRFIDDISIKYYRLKKLKWFIEDHKKNESIILQKSMLQSSYHEGIINRQSYEKVKDYLTHTSQPVHKEIPDYMLCKITLEIMEEPMTTEQGLTYEKSALDDHFMRNGMTQPISRKKLEGKVYPNTSLKNAIQNFLDDNPWAFEHNEDQKYEQIEF